MLVELGRLLDLKPLRGSTYDVHGCALRAESRHRAYQVGGTGANVRFRPEADIPGVWMLRRSRMIITLILAAATLMAIVYAVRLSLDPGNYFFYEPEDRAAWVYRPGSVMFVCSMMLIEAALAWGALISSWPHALWLRCLLGLAVLGPWALFSTMLVVHMPGYVLFHHLWVWLLVVLLTLTALGSMVRRLHRRLRGEASVSVPSKPPRSQVDQAH